VGGDTLHRCIGLLAPSGRAVVFGASAGELGSPADGSGVAVLQGGERVAQVGRDPLAGQVVQLVRVTVS
jgi:NADPH:quinone reductase-like Zn-dependent oxidoreductase